jgi:hypothetical protein
MLSAHVLIITPQVSMTSVNYFSSCEIIRDMDSIFIRYFLPRSKLPDNFLRDTREINPGDCLKRGYEKYEELRDITNDKGNNYIRYNFHITHSDYFP